MTTETTSSSNTELDEIRASVALSACKGMKWYEWKNWYNPVTRQWYNYRYFPELRTVVAFPAGNDYLMVAETVRRSLAATLQRLMSDEFGNRFYPEPCDDDDE